MFTEWYFASDCVLCFRQNIIPVLINFLLTTYDCSVLGNERMLSVSQYAPWLNNLTPTPNIIYVSLYILIIFYTTYITWLCWGVVSQQSEQLPVPARKKLSKVELQGGECSSAWELFLHLIVEEVIMKECLAQNGCISLSSNGSWLTKRRDWH